MKTKKIAISKFKSHCLGIIKKLKETNSSIVITKRNQAIATVTPIIHKKTSIFGLLKNKAEIKGDIVTSLNEEWNAEK